MKKTLLRKNILWAVTLLATVAFLFILGMGKGYKKIILGIPVCTLIFICRYYINKLNKNLSIQSEN